MTDRHKKNKPLRALLLSAGFGTRLKPITNKIPKCLVEINHKPILEISEYSDYHKIQQQIFALLQKKENNH